MRTSRLRASLFTLCLSLSLPLSLSLYIYIYMSIYELPWRSWRLAPSKFHAPSLADPHPTDPTCASAAVAPRPSAVSSKGGRFCGRGTRQVTECTEPDSPGSPGRSSSTCGSGRAGVPRGESGDVSMRVGWGGRVEKGRHWRAYLSGVLWKFLL